MKKVIVPIVSFVLGAIIFGSIGVYAASQLLAKDIVYKDTNVEAALNDLYIKKNFQSVSLLHRNMISGNTTTTYTFTEDVDLGIVVISASNDINDSSYYSASLDSLSNGSYQQIDSTSVAVSVSTPGAGHKTTIYKIAGVTSGTTMNYTTRFAGQIQILKIN